MDDKRAFSRIPVRLRAYLRPVMADAAPPVLRDVPPAGEMPAHAEELRGANLPEAVTATLVEINRKLDAVLSLLSQDRLAADYPLSAEIMELSGSGCQLAAETDFAVGQELELVLVLSAFPLRLAAAAGRIVRRVGSPGRKVWALDFTAIREGDLEAVVHFVFQEQRAAIRAQKWG